MSLGTAINLSQTFFTLLLNAKGVGQKGYFLAYIAGNLWRKCLRLPRLTKDRYLEFKDVNVWFSDSSGELSAVIEVFVRKDYEMDPTFIPEEDSVVFDIGANIGLFTISQAKRARSGSVFSFEPNPSTFKRMQKNLRSNGLSNVKAFNTAIYSENCELDLCCRAEASGMSSVIERFSNAHSPRHRVQAQPLDEITELNRVKKIDLMKIDVEGAEMEVLKGAQNTLALTDKVVIECHSEDLRMNVDAFLTQRGFRRALEIVGKPLFTVYFEKV